MPRSIRPDRRREPRGVVRRCTIGGLRRHAALHVAELSCPLAPTLTGLACLMLWASPVREGTTPMLLDLWILALTLGLFGVATGFVRVLERL